MVENKEGPFDLLKEIFITYGGFSYLQNECYDVISTMNNSYDKYYLKSEHFFI